MNPYTIEQADQMDIDTTFAERNYLDEFGGSELRDYAIVAAPTVGENDVRFYTDQEWQAWMADAYPEWSIEEMRDSGDPDISWLVWVIKRLCDTCEVRPVATFRSEGGSTPRYALCDSCAAAFDKATSAATCTCGHPAGRHQTGEGPWAGFCFGTLAELGAEYVGPGDDPTEACACEAFVAETVPA